MDETDVPSTCPWCAAPTSEGAIRCPACGAALAQRESIGDLMIPGLTSVDPALQDYDKRPLHLSGPSPTQGVAPALIAGAMAGGPIGLAAIGGVAAMAAVEYLGAGHGGEGSADLESVGKPSEVVLQALEHEDELNAEPEHQATGESEVEPDVWRDLPEPPRDPEQDVRREPELARNPEADVWRDLPEPVAGQDHIAEEKNDGG